MQKRTLLGAASLNMISHHIIGRCLVMGIGFQSEHKELWMVARLHEVDGAKEWRLMVTDDCRIPAAMAHDSSDLFFHTLHRS
jgi:hypothetical protein